MGLVRLSPVDFKSQHPARYYAAPFRWLDDYWEDLLHLRARCHGGQYRGDRDSLHIEAGSRHVIVNTS